MIKKIDASYALEHLPAPLSDAISAHLSDKLPEKRFASPDTRIALIALSCSVVALSAASAAARVGMYRRSVSREMKRCLAPMQKQLDELKAENARLAAMIEDQSAAASGCTPNSEDEVSAC